MNDAQEVQSGQATYGEPPVVMPPPLTASEVDSYQALRTDAVWFESAGYWSAVRGPKAIDALNGLVTNDVSALRDGDGQHAAALTPKGKILADMLIIRLDEQTLLLTVLRTASEAWMALARKYINPRLARVSDETDRYVTWMMYGACAPEAVATLGGADATSESMVGPMVSALSEWPVWHHGLWNIGPVSVRLIRAPLMGAVPGFILMADAADADLVRQRLEESAIRKGTRNVWNVARIEGGRPAWGIDMDDSTIPQEANLDALGAISFTKGCYTGQETVARIHFRGHVNRNLRGLLASAPLPQGASLVDETGKPVGDVRSSVISPRLGPIAIAMVRREVPEGASITALTPTGAVTVQVTTLPFPIAD